MDSLRKALAFAVEYQELLAGIFVVIGYLAMNAWKYDKPTTKFGRAFMKVVILMSFTAAEKWGFTPVKMPLRVREDDLKFLEEEKEKTP